MLNTIDEALNYLYSKRNKNKDLSRIKKCIKKLNISINYKIILITGTNGKGSTALFLKNILKNTYHVGCFTSPYVLMFNERIMINDRMISNSEIMHYGNILEDLNNWYLDTYKEEIPFFELTLLMALLYYQDREIDLGIFECGIGGLNDACNQLEPDLSIITSIGYDHLDKLGNTLEEILINKLGITRPNKRLLYSIYPNSKLDLIIKDYSSKNRVILCNTFNDVSNIIDDYKTSFTYKNHNYITNMHGKYQPYNASLAIEAVRIMFPGYPDIFIEEGIKETILPARLEYISKEPTIILDGAHNINAITMTVDYIKNIKNNKKVITLFSCLNNKAYKDMLNELDKITDKYLFYEFEDERKTDINVLMDSTNKPKAKLNDIYDIKDYINNDTILLITGSLHFASYIKNVKNLF